MLLQSILLFNYLVSKSFSLPPDRSILIRDAATTRLTFDATIADHNGVDITPNFRILLYQEPQQLRIGNLSERQARQSRLVNICGPSETFMSSHCNFKDGRYGSLQAYTIVCRHIDPPWQRGSPYSSTTHRTGFCLPDEICVTGTSQINMMSYERVTVRTATCVSQQAFRQWSRPGRNGQDPGISQAWAGLAQLTGTRVRAVVSQPDRQTLVEMDRLAIDAGISGGQTQKEQCRDCFNLGTKELGKGTDSLKAEAMLLTAGAAAGVLWLAIMSG